MVLQKLLNKYEGLGACERRNYLHAGCKLWYNGPDSETIDKDCPFGGMIGMGNSWLHVFLKELKFLRLHAILHDSAGYVKTKYNQGPGYCYIFEHVRWNSCFIGHISGIGYCLYLKFFDPLYNIINC